ncbi:MAG: protein kinase [Pyrinomonadaceae bacterium]|nr:protein kinase [Pyrinomonadaceae bacterium]
MKAERLAKIEEYYHAALDVSVKERPAFLREVCGSDIEIRREVESLLSFADVNSSLIDKPPIDVAAEIFSPEKQPEIVGTRIAHYEILSRIGSGGMGEVYLAADTQLERQVAIKFIKPDFSRDPHQVRRFLREAKTASSLNHPNIITVYEIGNTKNTPFIATEYIEGKTLRQSMKEGSLTFDESINIAVQVATALNAAHSAGIYHRDIKPENIMLRDDHLVKVLDFGLAKLAGVRKLSTEKTSDQKAPVLAEQPATNTEPSVTNPQLTAPGLVMGTAAYMSPEQARVDSVDARTDIWSLGVVVYEMVSGKKPFQGETSSEMIGAILEEKPVALDDETPDELRRILAKALEKDADDRFQSAEELLQELMRFRNETGFKTSAARVRSAMLSDVTSQNRSRISSPGRPGIDTDGFSELHVSNSSSAEFVLSEIKKNKTLWVGVLSVVLASFIVFGYFYFADTGRSFESIAVLPLVNESGDANLDYISDGVSDLLIDSLSQLPQLKVISRGSTFKYKGRGIDLDEIGDALKVQAILTGRVNRNGDDLMVSIELINVTDKTRIWGESYDRRLTDIHIVQRELAQTVSQKLRLKLSTKQQQRISKHLTNNPKAHQLYLNGLYHRRKNSIEEMKQSLEYFNRALELDPDFALAYAEKALVFSALIENGVVDPQTEKGKDRAVAEKALSIDPNLAEAHLALARIKTNEYDWAGADSSFRRAIELNPNLARAHSLYAGYFLRFERFDEALVEIGLAKKLDPLRATLLSIEGEILCWSGRYEEAIRVLQNSISMQPKNAFTHAMLGMTYTGQKRYSKAIDAWQETVKINGGASPTVLIYLGQNYALAGDREKALEILDQLNNTKEYVSPTELAILYTAFGDKEGTLRQLEKAYEIRDVQLQFLKAEPALDGFRNEPRFQEILRKIGLG